MTTPQAPAAHVPPGPFLTHMPIGSFAMVMGMSGLSLAWSRLGHTGFMPELSHAISAGVGVFAMAVFAVLLGIYAAKWSRNHKLVYDEWQHPIKSGFFAAVSISFALLGAVSTVHFPGIALPLWSIGAVLQVVAMIMVLNAWMHRETLQPAHATPVWFIPAVGNVVMPLAGVKLGMMEVSWWFFGVGMLFWLVLLTIVMHRLLFVQPPLPARLMPTLFIFLAPPAVGFLSWLLLTGQAQPSAMPLDMFGHLLYGLAFFFVIFLLSQVHRFAKLPFFMSWWAFGFPSAAFTSASLLYGQVVPSAWVVQIVGVLAVVATSVLIVFLSIRTLMAIVRNEPQFID